MGRLMDPTSTDKVGHEVIEAMIEAAERYHHVVTSYAQQEDDSYHVEMWVEPERVPPEPLLYWADDHTYGVLRTGPGKSERYEFFPSPEFTRPDAIACMARQVMLDNALGGA